MTTPFIITSICGEAAAFDATEVQSIIELEAITPAPRAPDHVLGLAGLRSRCLTVIDCAASLGLGQAGLSPAAAGRKAAVVEHEGHGYALILDDVEDVIDAESALEPVPGQLSHGWRRVARGIVTTPKGPLLVVDPAGLIRGPEEDTVRNEKPGIHSGMKMGVK